MIPAVNYIVDKQGKTIFVQLPIQDWEKMVAEYKHNEILSNFKKSLKTAFTEVREIQQGKRKATTMQDFLDEV